MTSATTTDDIHSSLSERIQCDQLIRRLLHALCLRRLQLAFAEEDQDEMSARAKLVDSLKTALRTQPHSFVLRFVELDGLLALLDALGSMDELTAHCSLHNAYIGCIKALMNNSVTFSYFIIFLLYV